MTSTPVRAVSGVMVNDAIACPSRPRVRRFDARADRREGQAAAKAPDYSMRPALLLEHRHGANRRAGAAAPFERQADERKFALADQRLEAAQAFDMRDVELEARLVHERVHHPPRSGGRGGGARKHNTPAGPPP